MNRTDADRLYWLYTKYGADVYYEFDSQGRPQIVYAENKGRWKIKFMTPDDNQIIIHIDPPPGTCKCNCGTFAAPHICEHDFSDWEEGKMPEGGSYGTAKCTRCGMTAMAHDIRCCP